MNVLRFLRPRLQHPDSSIRAAAVATLTNQSLLAAIATTDANDEVRLVALRRISDPDTRSEIARGTSPVNLRAAEGIIDPRLLAALARHAASVEVRRLAVSRIDDPVALAAIAAQDPDASIRQQARLKHRGANRVHEYLKAALAKLEVTAVAAAPAGTGGSLEDVCRALMQDSRFEIDAVVSEPELAGTAPGSAKPESAPGGRPDFVELLAHHRGVGGSAGGRGEVAHFQIKIWRRAVDVYEWQTAERRAELTNDVASWAASSNGSEPRR